MALTGLDIIVLIVIGGAAVLGFIRGFTTEILALAVWLVLVLAIKLLHTPLAAILAGIVGTAQGAAVLSFAILAGVTYFGGRIVANLVGSRTRQSFLGPIDRALGFGFGALKGLVLVSIAFLLVVLVVDTVSGGPSRRPDWIRDSKSYPLLDATSAFVADFVDRRRKGEPVFGEDGSERSTNTSRED
ncbi:CvpA family protein [Sphingomonas sp. HF-S3]|uniref:CvpA family protein n=1 Tax=Sphingomonas rustica TaxID=3103142 RepID=A0ABV0B8H5_9SPHN